MANIDDVLEKNKVRIDRINQPKKIKRTGATRPWQIGQTERYSGLSSEQNIEQLNPVLKNALSNELSPTEKNEITPDQADLNSSRNKESNQSLEASGLAKGCDTTTPAPDTHFLKPGQLKDNTDTIPTQNKTIPTQVFEDSSESLKTFRGNSTDTIPTQTKVIIRHDTDTNIDLIPTQKNRSDSEIDPLLSRSIGLSKNSTDTIPTQTKVIIRHDTDTNIDLIPTQYQHVPET